MWYGEERVEEMNIKDRKLLPGMWGSRKIQEEVAHLNAQDDFKIHPNMPSHPLNTIAGRLC